MIRRGIVKWWGFYRMIEPANVLDFSIPKVKINLSPFHS